MRKAPIVRWTREHSIIALNLYCKLPFGKLHRGNPVIIQVAERMGRTAGSLAMKLCNFASLDPVLRARGIRGLPRVSHQDREASGQDFQENLATRAEESEQLMHDLFTRDANKEVDFLEGDKVRLETASKAPLGATETKATLRVRRGQQFFRQSILNAYGVRCCVSGINVPQLLVASHIKPWRDFPRERLDPRNGLCLSALHDAAFDAGLIALNTKFALMLSKRLSDHMPQSALEQNFAVFEGKAIRLPDKLAEPDREYLRYHRESIFRH